MEFQFNAASGASYRIEATADLSNAWEVVESDIIGLGDVVRRLYSIGLLRGRLYNRTKKAAHDGGKGKSRNEVADKMSTTTTSETLAELHGRRQRR